MWAYFTQWICLLKYAILAPSNDLWLIPKGNLKDICTHTKRNKIANIIMKGDIKHWFGVHTMLKYILKWQC